MTKRRVYFSPSINIVLLDTDISICMTSENTTPDPEDKPDGTSANSTKEVNDSGFNENPFER